LPQDQPIIYLDNAATSYPKPEQVWHAMDEFARSGGANANRGQNPFARKASRLVEETRFKVANWLGLDTSSIRITFVPSASIALNQVILGTPLKAGEGVYLSPFEHNSVLRPVEHLRQSIGIVVQEIPFHQTQLTVERDKLWAMWRQLPPQLLILSQASNVCGLILPVEELAALARNINPAVVIIVDGAQAAGLYPLNLNNGLIDYLVWSGHKSFYGPFGVAGIAFCSEKRPVPVFFGGTGTFSESLQMPEELPSAYEPGSLNSPAIAGLNAALDWLFATGRDNITNHVSKLMLILQENLASLSGIRLIKVSAERRVGVLSCNLQGVTPQSLEEYLGNQNISVRAGLHCSPKAHSFLDTIGRGGTVRFSPGFFNTTLEIGEVISTFISLIE